MRVFCYGTLKKGFSANYRLEDSPFLGRAVTHPRYRLYNMGNGFPGMVVDGQLGTGVIGELYEIRDCCLPAIDHYEAVRYGLFRREQVELSDGSTALAYLFNQSYDGCPVIESGEWTENGEGNKTTD